MQQLQEHTNIGGLLLVPPILEAFIDVDFLQQFVTFGTFPKSVSPQVT